MPFAGKRLAPISDTEKQGALADKNELTGFVSDNTERLLFLKFAFRRGDISTVWIDPARAADLFWALKKLLRDRAESEGSPSKFEAGIGPQWGGYWFSAT